MGLERFHNAQQDSRSAGYETALAEIRAGQKRSHWILVCLSSTLKVLVAPPRPHAYALRDLDEACDYLRDPVLSARYQEIAGAVKRTTQARGFRSNT